MSSESIRTTHQPETDRAADHGVPDGMFADVGAAHSGVNLRGFTLVPPYPVDTVRRYASGDELGGTEVDSDIAETLRRHNGSGQPLDRADAARFGGGFGADLSGVRVHTDAEADTMARSVQSLAFTYGHDVYFSRGSFAPGTESGDHLLAHELAHVVQGSSGRWASGGSGVQIGRADDPAEASADKAADAVMAQVRHGERPDPVVLGTLPAVQGEPIARTVRRASLKSLAKKFKKAFSGKKKRSGPKGHPAAVGVAPMSQLKAASDAAHAAHHRPSSGGGSPASPRRSPSFHPRGRAESMLPMMSGEGSESEHEEESGSHSSELEMKVPFAPADHYRVVGGLDVNDVDPSEDQVEEVRAPGGRASDVRTPDAGYALQGGAGEESSEVSGASDAEADVRTPDAGYALQGGAGEESSEFSGASDAEADVRTPDAGYALQGGAGQESSEFSDDQAEEVRAPGGRVSDVRAPDAGYGQGRHAEGSSSEEQEEEEEGDSSAEEDDKDADSLKLSKESDEPVGADRDPAAHYMSGGGDDLDDLFAGGVGLDVKDESEQEELNTVRTGLADPERQGSPHRAFLIKNLPEIYKNETMAGRTGLEKLFIDISMRVRTVRNAIAILERGGTVADAARAIWSQKDFKDRLFAVGQDKDRALTLLREQLDDQIEFARRQDLPLTESGDVGDVADRKVHYDTAEEQKKSAVSVRGGKLYRAGGELVDTSKSSTFHSGNGAEVFVADDTGEIHMGSHQAGKYHHSSLLAGAKVSVGGEIKVTGGRIEWISNKSGHYTPTKQHLVQFVHWLGKDGVNLASFVINEGFGFKAGMSAMQFVAGVDDEGKRDTMEGFYGVKLAALLKIYRRDLGDDTVDAFLKLQGWEAVGGRLLSIRKNKVVDPKTAINALKQKFGAPSSALEEV